MKKTVALFVTLICTLLLFGCSKDESLESSQSLVGVWIDVETESMIEFTEDGYYLLNVAYDPLQELTRYEAKDGKITLYYESDRQGTEFSMDYEIDSKGHLIINDEIEYRPIEIATEKE